MSSIKTGECDEICVEDVRDIISGDVAGSANKDRAEAQKDQSPCYYRGGCAGVEGCYCDAAGKADAAQAQASQQQQTVGELKTDVSDLKTNLLNTTVTLQEAQKSISDSPASLHYKGVTITPGGFVAAEFVRRSRALGAEATPFNAVTMPGASQSTTSEFFGSGRQSRLSLLVQGQVKNAKLAGYYETDFLSAGVTSNNNQTNSYTLRQRQAFAQVAFDSGWTLTGGQMWTLLT